jgi:hypothetical protein
MLTAGLPLHVRLLQFLASGLGLSGIIFIMLSATKRLEGKQADMYGASADLKTREDYAAYLQRSNALIPRLF